MADLIINIMIMLVYLILGYSANSAEIVELIRASFPKLIGVDVELMRALSGGYGKQLLPLSATTPVPAAAYLRAARVSTLFIRPLTRIQLVSNQAVLYKALCNQIM